MAFEDRRGDLINRMVWLETLRILVCVAANLMIQWTIA